jgi:hypothetical protein
MEKPANTTISHHRILTRLGAAIARRMRTPVSRDNYAVSGDGQRFLINDFTETSAPPLTVVLNWTADLKRN